MYKLLQQGQFTVEAGAVPLLQDFATCIAAVGSGVLLTGVLTGNVDGTGGWWWWAGFWDIRFGPRQAYRSCCRVLLLVLLLWALGCSWLGC
jgi:hypothetical protein